MRITVCRDCKERYPACHDYCEKYKEQKQSELDALKSDRKQRTGDYILHQMYSERMVKRNKRKK